MNGCLGVLSIEGKQVGGFLDWEIDVDIREVSASAHKQYAIQKWKAVARKFWLFEIPDTPMDATFYTLFHDDLVAVSENRVKVNIPDIPLNTLINHNLEMLKGG